MTDRLPLIQTERKMVQVCEGTITKNDMIVQALEQYKEMFTIVRRDFQRVTSVSTCAHPQYSGTEATQERAALPFWSR